MQSLIESAIKRASVCGGRLTQGSCAEGYGHLLLQLQPEFFEGMERREINKEERLSITQSVKIFFPLSQHEIAPVAEEPWLEGGVAKIWLAGPDGYSQ